MNVGLLGCGHIGISHCAALLALSRGADIRVTALADANPQNLARAAEFWPTATRYSQARALLQAKNLHAVHICLPTNLHTPFALEAMQQGLHVFVEKPLCLTEKDCAALLAAQSSSGVFAAVGHVLRFTPEYEFLKAACASGRYGPLRLLTMQRLCGRAQGWFFDQDKSGSVVLDLHIHDLDLLRWIMGSPKAIFAKGAQGRGGVVTHVFSHLCGGGADAFAEALWDTCPTLPFRASYRAHFAQATLAYHSGRPTPLCVYGAEGEAREIDCREGLETPPPEAAGILPYYRELAYFYRCLGQNRPPEQISLQQGVGSVQLALNVLAMAQNAPGGYGNSPQK